MVHHEDRHADHARDRHIDDVNEHGDNGAWQQFRLDEGVGMLREKNVLTELRQGFGKGNSEPCIESLD